MIALSLAGIALISLLAQWLAWSPWVPCHPVPAAERPAWSRVTGVLGPGSVAGGLLLPGLPLGRHHPCSKGALTLHPTELKGSGKGGAQPLFGGHAGQLRRHRCGQLLPARAGLAGRHGARRAVLVVTIYRWSPWHAQRDPAGAGGGQDPCAGEGIVIDPIGALFAVLVFEAVRLGSQSDVLIHPAGAGQDGEGVGSSMGAAAGWLTTLLIRKDWLPVSLQSSVCWRWCWSPSPCLTGSATSPVCWR